MHAALTIGTWVGLVYAVLAALVIVLDRGSKGGSWISLAGMGSYLLTLPVSYLAERLGHRLDHRSNVDMAFAVSATGLGLAALVGLLAFPFTL